MTSAIDGDRPTLHIRCGSDIREPLRQAGLAGDFLEYADPVCEGPVPDGPDLIAVRARYLAGAYGATMGLTQSAIETNLRQAERRLGEAHRYTRVVLWFEHDSHDQLVLARCLSRLSDSPLPQHLELICIDNHPSVPRFNGLGQLAPDALAGLWPRRTPITPEQRALGRGIWTALRAPDPTGLQAIAQTGTPALPVAANALRRHLRELPATGSGVSLTQRLILELLQEMGPTRIGRLFAAMVLGKEPLVFMGDLGFLRNVEAMACTSPPVLTIEPGEKPFRRLAAMTDTGAQVLAGERDYLSLAPPERWAGGVRADSGWRFDQTTDRVVLTT